LFGLFYFPVRTLLAFSHGSFPLLTVLGAGPLPEAGEFSISISSSEIIRS
jgi:hypothetical protein